MQHVTSQVKTALEILETVEVGRYGYDDYSAREDLAARLEPLEELCAA